MFLIQILKVRVTQGISYAFYIFYTVIVLYCSEKHISELKVLHVF